MLKKFLEVEILKVYEKNFRETYKQICLLTGAAILEKVNLRDIFDYPVEDEMNGFIAYGYVDADTGFNFKILAGAQVDGDKIKVFPASYKKNFAVRRADIEEAEIQILAEKYSTAFTDKIKVIEDAFAFDAAKEKTRYIKTIDSLRHPNFPDDVAVYFHGENFEPEQAWVRCTEVEGNLITGTLLHELQQNFGVRSGDKINFGVADFNGENICAVIWK